MTSTTHSTELMNEGRPNEAWRFSLRKVGLVYILSRLCVAVGAAIALLAFKRSVIEVIAAGALLGLAVKTFGA